MLERKAITNNNILDVFNDLLALWKTLQHNRTEKKNFTCFPSLVSVLFGKTKVQLILLIYLHIIITAASEYSTIIEIFHQSRMPSQKCSIQYTHIL